MEIFEGKVEPSSPLLSSRFYPETWEDFVGQEHLVGPQGAVRRLVEAGRLPSMLFYGPPGTGKTALARLLSLRVGGRFFSLNASLAKPSDLKRLLQQAVRVFRTTGRPAVVFVDEIHRFNRLHQEVLLASTEAGQVVFIGSTVLNPYTTLSKALLSRVLVFEFRSLEETHLVTLLQRALQRFFPERRISPEALQRIARLANGDARRALNLLDAVLVTVPEDREGTVADVDRLVSRRLLRFDRAGDDHYDTTSAWIKSLRGSDPDAAIYYTLRLLEGGEDPRFLFRRLLIFAAEDIGLADPRALLVAQAGAAAFEQVGRPEGDLILTEVVLYLATAPKSNTVLRTLNAARRAVQEETWAEIPQHLRDSHYAGARKLGRGKGYLYPHDHPEAAKHQTYLPKALQHLRFFEPRAVGYEAQLRTPTEEVET